MDALTIFVIVMLFGNMLFKYINPNIVKECNSEGNIVILLWYDSRDKYNQVERKYIVLYGKLC